MARIFITGSADGLGRATAQTVRSAGHEVIIHARSAERLAAVHGAAGVAPGVEAGTVESALAQLSAG